MIADGSDFVFMDPDTYDQVQLQPDLLGDMVGFLKPEMNVEVEFYGENPIGIELPQTVDLVVTQTMPAIKGPELGPEDSTPWWKRRMTKIGMAM